MCQYGPSLALTVGSFSCAELTGVLAVYLYIVQCKHAYHKHRERGTPAPSGPTLHRPPSASLSCSASYERVSGGGGGLAGHGNAGGSK